MSSRVICTVILLPFLSDFTISFIWDVFPDWALCVALVPCQNSIKTLLLSFTTRLHSPLFPHIPSYPLPMYAGSKMSLFLFFIELIWRKFGYLLLSACPRSRHTLRYMHECIHWLYYPRRVHWFGFILILIPYYSIARFQCFAFVWIRVWDYVSFWSPHRPSPLLCSQYTMNSTNCPVLAVLLAKRPVFALLGP